MNDIKCTYCGATELELGFILDSGRGAKGVHPVGPGSARARPLGGVTVVGRPKWQVEVYRCPQCSHLEMFAPQPS